MFDMAIPAGRKLGSIAAGSLFAEYAPEKWNLEAREKFAAHRYGVFIVWGIYANYAQGEWYLHNGRLDRLGCVDGTKMPSGGSPSDALPIGNLAERGPSVYSPGFSIFG